MLSQVEPTENIHRLLTEWGMGDVRTTEDLVSLRNKMFSSLTFRTYDDSTKEEEKKIRWKRTGAQVLEDSYVYRGKACTDLVVAFLTLARAGGVKGTRFVKLKDEKAGKIHSVAEIELEDGWYIFDVDSTTSVPEKGEIREGVPWDGFFLWKKGRDAWDLGLTEYDTQSKVLQ